MLYRLHHALQRARLGLAAIAALVFSPLPALATTAGGSQLTANVNWLTDAAYIITGPATQIGLGILGVGSLVHFIRAGEIHDGLAAFAKIGGAAVGIMGVHYLVTNVAGAIL